ncbi:hypothetical protein BDV98DRAFT_557166 [Pterulicium gracile]|uniref:Fe2OG dioxygenase domain-containing protein n=1 Tax=Pterulicium gracile TaxID=1884261 RepID=A0A5C3R6Y8_9AGAR|nr:hypothetical protein BDV98DRAFT_557166 [Pterula gracilis]
MPPKKKVTQTKAQPGPASSSSSASATPSISFPALSPKIELGCSVLLPDQIITFDNLFTAAECKQFTKLIDNLPLELTPPKKRGEADRVNYRVSVKSTDFALKLQELLAPHLPTFPYPASSRMRNTTARRAPHSFNSNIRMYKYTSEQYFGAHYDDSVRDADTGAKSEWTLLIYLSGVEDGVQGGETVFYNEVKGKPREEIVAPLTRGTALLHRHGNECMLHEGSLVKSGTKYVLRSDLMFL